MEAEYIRDGQRGDQTENGAADKGTNTDWLRRHMSDSIYIWACGEKADDKDDDPKLSDRLIGWIVLFVQGFAYAMLIFLARATSSSDTSSSTEESGYLLPSVTGAMYLLVASTAHDLRAGFSLLVDGSRPGHRAFGVGLLAVYGIMICAAMTVLVSTSNDSASVVLNAVTVVFIADLDEKALKFLLTVPQTWRLFWAIECIAMSFALAVVAIFYMGDSSPLLEGNNVAIQFLPTWFVWGVNPVAVTVCSYVLSSTLQAVCEFCSEGMKGVDEVTAVYVAASLYEKLRAIITTAKEHLRGEPCFCICLSVWVAQVVANFHALWENDTYPLAFTFVPTTVPTNELFSLAITDSKLDLLCINAVMVTGLAVMAWRAVPFTMNRVNIVPSQLASSEERTCRETWCAESRVPSMLVGWGIGYWVTSLLYVLLRSWNGGGWNNAPILVTIIAYVILPCFSIVCIFAVCEINFLGTRFGTFVKPAVVRLTNRRRVGYWIMASVFRDILVVWIGFCDSVRSELVY